MPVNDDLNKIDNLLDDPSDIEPSPFNDNETDTDDDASQLLTLLLLDETTIFRNHDAKCLFTSFLLHDFGIGNKIIHPEMIGNKIISPFTFLTACGEDTTYKNLSQLYFHQKFYHSDFEPIDFKTISKQPFSAVLPDFYTKPLPKKHFHNIITKLQEWLTIDL